MMCDLHKEESMRRTKLFTATTMFLLAAMFVFCGAAAAVNKTLTVGTGSGDINATVSLPITISDATGVGGIAFTLTYDPSLFTFAGLSQATKVITDGLKEGGYTTDEYKNDLFFQVNDEGGPAAPTGRVLVAAASANALSGTNTVLFNAKFTIKGGDYKGYYIGITQTLITNSAAGYATPTFIPVLMGTTTPNGQGNYTDTNFPEYAATLVGGTINVAPLAVYSIGGTVTYGSGGVYASGCTVVLSKETAPSSGVYAFNAQTTVGATGKFSFSNRTAGNYKIHVASLNPNYNDYDSSVIPLSGSITNADAALTSKPMASVTGTVTGNIPPGLMVKVTDGTGEAANVMGIYAVNQNGTWQSAPLPQGTPYHWKLVYGNLESAYDATTFDTTQLKTIGGTISGMTGTGTLTATSVIGKLSKSKTVSNGAYTIDNLVPANDYIVSVTSAGFPVTYYNGKTDITQATPVNISGDNASGINFAFSAPGSSIKGTITETITESDQPVASIGVYAFNINTFALIPALTNGSGAYELGVTAGSYEVFVIKPNGKIFYFYNAGGLATQNEANATILTVAASEILEGKNIDLSECNKTLSGKVTYSSSTGDPAANVLITASTANTKSIGVTGQDGQYTVGGLCSATTYSVEVKPLSGNYPVQTEAIVGGTTTNKNFVIFTGFELSGTVKETGSDQNIVGAMVYLEDQLTGALVGGRLYYTGSDGKYSIRGIQTGTYTLVVSHPDYRTSTVDIPLGDNTTKNVTLQKGDYFKGTVTDGSNPLAGATIIASTGTDPAVYATTGNSGAYAVYGLVAANSYAIMAQKPGYARQAKTGQNPSASGVTADFTLAPLSTTYSVSGTVKVGSTALPGAIVLISISNQTQNFFGSATTDANGGYTISGLPGSGDYQFVVIPGGNLPSQSETLAVSGDILNKDVTLSTGNSISGTISGVSSATIYVFLYKASQYVGYTKAAGGAYTFSGLVNGTDYKVLAVAAGYTSLWYDNKSSIGEATQINNNSASVTGINITLVAQ